MEIFIDEAGAFVPPTSNPRDHSLVLALIVPSARLKELQDDFLRLRDSWPTNPVEVKGSRLNEAQTAEVAQLLAQHDVFVEFQAIDMSLHPAQTVETLKERQAAAITANITPQHQPTMIRELEELAEDFRTMSNQLFVQALLTIHLVIDTVQDGTLYHVQRSPIELGRLAWTIDRKDRDLTTMERAWTRLILPAGQSQSATAPFRRLVGADYSHFSKYEINRESTDPDMVRHIQWMAESHPGKDPDRRRYLNWKRILTDDRAFTDSRDSLGVQLADIAATTLRRAFNNRLRREGWEPLGKLLIRKTVVPFVMLGTPGDPNRRLDGHATEVWRTLESQSKSMLIQE